MKRYLKLFRNATEFVSNEDSPLKPDSNPPLLLELKNLININDMKLLFKNDSLSNNFFSKELLLRDYDTRYLIQKKSFLNFFIENLQFYSYRIIYSVLNDTTYKDDVDIYNRIYVNNAMVSNQFNLILAMLFDKIYFLFMLNVPLFNYFFKNTFNFSEFNILLLNNPEYFYIYETNLLEYYKLYFSSFYISIHLLYIDESFLTPIFSILQIFSLIFLVTLYMLLYFIYFNTFFKEDSIIDHDFLTANITIEAEEEIGSMDDILMASVILIFLFL